MQPNEGRRRFHPATHVHGASEHQGLEFDPIRDRGDREDVRLMTGTAQRAPMRSAISAVDPCLLAYAMSVLMRQSPHP